MHLDSENWMEGSIEFENDYFHHLRSCVTNNGYSDWAITKISADIKFMWHRLSQHEDDYCIGCSDDCIRFKLIICMLVQERLNLEFCLHSRIFSFKSVFTDMKLTDVNGKCMMVNSRMRCY